MGPPPKLWIDEAHALAKLLNEELARREAETARVLDLDRARRLPVLRS